MSRSAFWPRHLAALLLFAAALALRLAVAPIDGSLAFLTFYPATAVAFIALGAGPGWLVVALGALSGYALFTAPQGNLVFSQLGLLNLTAYVLSSALVAWVVARQHTTAASLAQARSRLQDHERELTERETFHQRVADHLPVQLAYVGRDTRHQFVNEAYCHTIGQGREMILGRSRAELALADGADSRAEAHQQAVWQGLAQQFEQAQLNDGVERRLAVQWVPDFDASGKVVGHFHLGMDVTESSRIRQALEDSESLLLQSSRVAGVGGWQMDLATQALTWSEQTRRIHEVPDDFQPNLASGLAFYPPKAREIVAAAVQHSLETGEGWDLELPFVTARGRALWVHAMGEVQSQDGRPVKLIGVFKDVTEKRELRLRLDEASAQLADLYDNAPCAYYSVNEAGRFVKINALTLSWLGCSREEALDGLGPCDFFTEGGRAQFRENFPAFMKRGRVGPLAFELLSRDGQRRWVSLSATAVYDDQGRFVKSRSVMYDVTELHQARSALKQLSAEQAAMLDNELVAIVKLRQRRAVWINKALERLFGYRHDELIHQPARMLYPDDAAYERLGQLAYPILATGGHVHTQLQMRHKAGHLIWVDVSGFMVSPESGESMWLMTDISALKAQQDRAEQAALHDPLTGLPNRRLLSDRLQQAVGRSQRQEGRLLLCYLDLDGFKAVNDQHGHGAGDQVLQATARRLQAGLRAGDTVARLGGDEFVLLMAPMQDLPEGQAALERVVSALAEPVPIGPDTEVRVSASIGVALYPEDGSSLDELLQTADAAMYEAKRQGKNQVSGWGRLASLQTASPAAPGY